MPILFLLCGLPGSGKSRLAKRIERERPALRLTPDEWMERIIVYGYDEDKRAAIESLQWDIAQRALSLGVDIILESGFWSREERMRFRERAAELGAETAHLSRCPARRVVEAPRSAKRRLAARQRFSR